MKKPSGLQNWGTLYTHRMPRLLSILCLNHQTSYLLFLSNQCLLNLSKFHDEEAEWSLWQFWSATNSGLCVELWLSWSLSTDVGCLMALRMESASCKVNGVLATRKCAASEDTRTETKVHTWQSHLTLLKLWKPRNYNRSIGWANMMTQSISTHWTRSSRTACLLRSQSRPWPLESSVQLEESWC